MFSCEFDKTIITDMEQQLQISSRMAFVEHQLLHLTEQSVEKMYIKGAFSEVDCRLTAIESGHQSAVYEVDRRLHALESAFVPEFESRIKAMEASLHELGSHFVRYQKDLVDALLKKFQVLVTQMHAQEEKNNVALQEAEAKIKRCKMAEIDSIKDKGSDDGRDLSTRDTASTATSEESDKYRELDKYAELEKVMYVELEKLMCDARNGIEVVWSDLRAHADSTNKRIMALEKGITDAAAKDMPGESQFNPPPLPSFAAKSTKGEEQAMFVKDLEAAFQGLTSAVSRSCLGRASSEQLLNLKYSQRDLSRDHHRTLSADVAKEQRDRHSTKPILSYNVPGKMEKIGGSLKVHDRTANSGPTPCVSESLQGATMPRQGSRTSMQTSGFQSKRDASPQARGPNSSRMSGTRSSCSPAPSSLAAACCSTSANSEVMRMTIPIPKSNVRRLTTMYEVCGQRNAECRSNGKQGTCNYTGV